MFVKLSCMTIKYLFTVFYCEITFLRIKEESTHLPPPPIRKKSSKNDITFEILNQNL